MGRGRELKGFEMSCGGFVTIFGNERVAYTRDDLILLVLLLLLLLRRGSVEVEVEISKVISARVTATPSCFVLYSGR